MSKSKQNKASEVTVLVPNENGDLVKQEAPQGEASAEAPAAKGRKRGLNEDDPYMKQVIFSVKSENPKRKGSKSFARYALYEAGMTVGAFIKAGGTRGDINWDTAHGHIVVHPAGAAKPAESNAE